MGVQARAALASATVASRRSPGLCAGFAKPIRIGACPRGVCTRKVDAVAVDGFAGGLERIGVAAERLGPEQHAVGVVFVEVLAGGGGARCGGIYIGRGVIGGLDRAHPRETAYPADALYAQHVGGEVGVGGVSAGERVAPRVGFEGGVGLFALGHDDVTRQRDAGAVERVLVLWHRLGDRNAAARLSGEVAAVLGHR